MARPARDDREVAYVALGDSISIDDYAGGRGRGGASLLASNLDEDFPAWHGHDLGPQPFLLLATDGATSRTLLEQQLPALRQRGVPPQVVTVTIGGNDVLGCYGDTPSALRAADAALRRVDEGMSVLRSLGGSSVDIVLGTVYDPSDGTADAAKVGLPPWPDVVDVIAHLNDGLRVVAGRHGALVAEIHATFLGHGLASGDPGQPDARPTNRDLWYCLVIEPNAWGADGVRRAFWKALGRQEPEDLTTERV